MTTKEIAAVFEEIAVLLELKGENPFRVRAFSNAARFLKASELSTDDFIRQLQTSGVKGFGPQLAENILTLHETDGLPLWEELRASFPDSLLDFLRIPGLGAKKVKVLYEDLNLTTLEQLREACEQNKVSALKGFGKKTEQNILKGIEQYETYRTQFRFDTAEAEAKKIVSYLQEAGLADRIEIAGSLRRKKETVKDIDLLACVSDPKKQPEKIMAAFTAYPETQSVRSHGTSKSSIVTMSGIGVDLRVIDDSSDKASSFATALLHFTGSKEHNTALRTLAKQKDYKLNEYGLWSNDKALDLSDEAAVYRALELAYIPPERRECLGEIEQAHSCFERNEELPRLVQLEDIKGVIHAHTTYSDGANTLEEMANAAVKRGYQYLAVSDHSQSAAYAGGLKQEDIIRQHEEIDRLNAALRPFKIFKGIESDILADGSLDYENDILARFDFVIASIHSRLSMSESEMTERIIRAVQNPFTTILGHPTGRLLLRREPYALDIHAVLQAAAEFGVAVELNANPRRFDLDWRLHQKAHELGILVPICPDAHSIEGMDLVRFGVGIAQKGGLLADDVMNTWDCSKIEEYFLERREAYSKLGKRKKQ